MTTYKGKTGSAAAMVAGVVTLMLQANPTLTWRWTKFFPIFYRFLIRDHSDVQHILIRSADRHAIGWHDIPEDADDSFSIGDVFQSTVKFNLRNIFFRVERGFFSWGSSDRRSKA